MKGSGLTMDPQKLIKILSAPLTLSFGTSLILVGLYSLTLNVASAKTLNHPRAEKFARIGGWLYILGGAGIILYSFF